MDANVSSLVERVRRAVRAEFPELRVEATDELLRALRAATLGQFDARARDDAVAEQARRIVYRERARRRVDDIRARPLRLPPRPDAPDRKIGDAPPLAARRNVHHAAFLATQRP